MIQVKCIVFIADENQGGDIILKDNLDIKSYLLNPIILKDFDCKVDVVGKVIDLTWDENKLVATMEIPGDGLSNFPAIGYHIKNGFNELISVALCKKPNVDSRMKTIGEQVV